MVKKLLTSCSAMLISGSAVAGGLSTNTAANAAYLRSFSQEANVDISSLYANPAGTAFLDEGWHFGLSLETVFQQRNITTGITYPLTETQSLDLLKFNPQYNSENHKYVGKALAPLVPSLDFVYNTGNKWSFSGHLGLAGGGGACEFLDGIGTFDALFAGQMFSAAVTKAAGAIMADPARMSALQTAVTSQCIAAGITDPAIIAQQVGNAVKGQAVQDILPGYKAGNDGYMKGSNYMYGLQLGATYKILDNLAVYAAVRGIYAKANYNGYIQDAEYSIDGGQSYTPYQSSVGPRDNVLSMNCDQKGIGVSPILGVHWSINEHWNIGAKYEFKTRIRLENTTRMNRNTQLLATQETINGQTNYALNTMAQFADGKTVAEDIPGYLAAGVQYSPIAKVKINASYHLIQEKGATKYANKQDLIDDNTREYLASAEWQCSKKFTISCGWQKTMYGVSDAGMNDISFNIDSNSLGFGLRFEPNSAIKIDLGYMHTFYEDRDVFTSNWMSSGLNRKDTFSRKNDVIGVAFNFSL